MGKGRKKKKEEDQDTDGSSGSMPPQRSKEIQVPYEDSPPSPPPGQKIHPRKPIPPLPKGRDIPDEDTSPPVEPE